MGMDGQIKKGRGKRVIAWRKAGLYRTGVRIVFMGYTITRIAAMKMAVLRQMMKNAGNCFGKTEGGKTYEYRII